MSCIQEGIICSVLIIIEPGFSRPGFFIASEIWEIDYLHLSRSNLIKMKRRAVKVQSEEPP